MNRKKKILSSLLDSIDVPPVWWSGATLIYSLRQINPSATKCINVRRSSDNATQDFGFVAGYLDTASLLTFVGAGNGFVTTWYEQNNIAYSVSNPTLARQPEIVVSGALNLVNGKTAIWFDFFNTRCLFGNVAAPAASTWIASCVLANIATGIPTANIFRFGNDNHSFNYLGCATGGSIYTSSSWNTLGTAFLASVTEGANPSQSLVTTTLSSSQNLLLTRNAVNGSPTNITGTLNVLNDIVVVGAKATNTNPCNHNVQELLLFNGFGDDATKKSTIIANQRSYYSPY